MLDIENQTHTNKAPCINYTIHHLPVDERPRERLMRYGSESISTTELLAIILGSGMRGKTVLQLSQELLSCFGGVKGIAEATVEELCQIKGLGVAKAVQLKAAFSLGIKAAACSESPKFRIDNPIHAYHLVKDELEHEKRELFVVILLDTRGCVICHNVVAIGTLSQALVHPREVFYPAIRHKAASVILAHNHPSGDPTPSKYDIEVTESLVEAGKLIEIPIQDHLIIGRNSYTSLRQKGIQF